MDQKQRNCETKQGLDFPAEVKLGLRAPSSELEVLALFRGLLEKKVLSEAGQAVSQKQPPLPLCCQ